MGPFSINSHMPNLPLTPQTTMNVCIHNFCLVLTLYRVGKEEPQENFQKDKLKILWQGTQKLQNIMLNTALLSQGLLYMAGF